LKIRAIDSNDRKNWDRYVLTHPNSSPYHLYAWQLAVNKAYGHRAYYLMAEEDAQVRGILPLIFMKPPLLSGHIVSLPFCDVGDILADDDNTKLALIEEAVSVGQELGAKYIELRGHQSSSIKLSGIQVSVRSHKVRMFLNLPKSSEILWKSFKSKLRSQIRKAESNGLVFKWGSLNDLNDFYNVFSRNMRDLGSPVHSREWFFAVLQNFGEHIRIGLVFYDKQLIGAGLILSFNDTVSIPWASTLNEYNKLSPNMLLYWNLLRFASDSGYVKFDFGRSILNEGTYRFKAQWGAEPVPLYWHFITLNNNTINFDAKHSSHKETIVRIWRRLPLGIANCLGPVIRKHISL
jgi:FemAB-related protein (PEP-CTERM system-associated)